MADPIVHGSEKEPIVVEETRVEKNRYVKWQYEFIGRKLGYYHKQGQALVKTADGHVLDKVTVKVPNGQEHVFWFDVTVPLKADQKMLEGVAKEMGLPPDLMK